MAKSYITYLLREKLGTYLEGLENTELTFGLSAHLEMANVKVKEESIAKFEMPIDIKFGIIKKLKVSRDFHHLLQSILDVINLTTLLRARFESLGQVYPVVR